MNSGYDETDWEAISELAKKNHKERVAKTPDRIKYAEEQFIKNDIYFAVKNANTGHVHVWDANGKLYQFWASTGKILGYPQRGIHNMIKLIKN